MIVTMPNVPNAYAPPKKKEKRKDQHQKIIADLTKQLEEYVVDIGGYEYRYWMVDGYRAVELFETYRPIRLSTGRLKDFPYLLLHSASEAVRTAKFSNKYAGVGVGGLMYPVPEVPKRHRWEWKLSYAGLMVIDHWADKYPRFKSYVDAFITDKDRKEIVESSAMMRMGIPTEEVYDRAVMNAKYKMIIEKEKEKKIRQIMARNSYIPPMTNVHSATTIAPNSTLVGSSATWIVSDEQWQVNDE